MSALKIHWVVASALLLIPKESSYAFLDVQAQNWPRGLCMVDFVA